MSWDERTRLLLGEAKTRRLADSNVLVVGLGGVGAYVAEMLCRAGIGQMTIVDGDFVEAGNRNRQLSALISNEGKSKVEVIATRLLDINSDLRLTAIHEYLRDERTVELLDSQHFDYVADCIDTLSPKIFLLYHAVKKGTKVISSMGSGGKLDPAKVQISDIARTHDCNLARMVRKRLHRLGIFTGIQTVFSPEEVPQHAIVLSGGLNKLTTVGTISYMPAIFGCFMASAIIGDLTVDS
jgi:tRNA threonylcarbamoyladenosine dehydratase